MNLQSELIFFFSALGAFNALLLSFYFAFIAKRKRFANYYLSFLLLVISIRIIKSVFFYYNRSLASVFIQIGLSGCILIGPFLYLYISSQIQEKKKNWVIHIIPFLLLITVVGYFYPYWEYRKAWYFVIKGIYLQWLMYILFSAYQIKTVFQKLFKKKTQLTDLEKWLLSIVIGTFLIWLAYNTTKFTSYIVGALSFSFVFYLLVLLWVFKRNKNTLFFEEKPKYSNKKINIDVVEQLSNDLKVIETKTLFKNPDLKLADVAKELNVMPHTLSQYLNENLGKSFKVFINEFRIEEAKNLLLADTNYTIEAIGYESGFNSKSTFFTAFKNITGTTPSKYKAQNT